MDIKPAEWDKKQLKLGASFLQSSAWGDFQKSVGIKPHFLAEPGWSCLLLEKKTPLGTYLFAPYGPTLTDAASLLEALKSIKNYAKRGGFDWLTIEPYAPARDSHILRKSLPKLDARPSDHNREPDLTRVVDLSPAPEKLLASISQSTRSLIRKNQREKQINFKTSTDPEDIAIFSKMLGQVTERKGVSFFNDGYFKKQARKLMPAGMMYLELAFEHDKPVASAIFHDYGDTSSYTYAGTLPEARKTSASALLLWQAMQNAKHRGMKKMDLYGIAPDDAPDNHPWAGFSSFKKKFGGEIIQHAGTWDIPLTGRYWLNRSAKNFRKLFRRH
jgi:lipid II:glycine glycyltransferase (peptidoglycan interpeptide bridge formation enzyme)